MTLRSPTRRAFIRAAVGTSGALLIGCDSGGGGGDGSGAEAGSDTGGETGSATTSETGVDLTGDGAGLDVIGGEDAGAGAQDAGAGDQAMGGGGVDAHAEDSYADTASAAEDTGPDIEPAPDCDDPFARGMLLSVATILSDGTAPLDTPLGAGLDGRLYTELETLDPDSLITPIDTWYIRTRVPDTLVQPADWKIKVHGLVGEPFDLSLSQDLEHLIQPMGQVLMECSGNGDFAHFGMLSNAEWHGVPIQDILDMIDILPEATQIKMSGYDEHTQPSFNSTKGCAWIFPIDAMVSWGAFLGTHMNGEPLTADHGFPIRLMMPRWYGCCNAKWLNEIELVGDLEPPTSQMVEFASRTHQLGVPSFAKDYLPANMDQTAMPVRVEKWSLDGEISYRVVGIMWGGTELTDALEVRFGSSQYEPVDVCPTQTTHHTWTLWSHQWTPEAVGNYEIQCRIADPSIQTRRLDSGFYNRTVYIDEV